MLSMRLDAQDEKYRSTRPSKRRERKSTRTHVKAYLRTVVEPAEPGEDDPPFDAHVISDLLIEGAL